MSSKHRLTRSFRTLSALVYLVSSFLLTAKALKIVHVTPAVFTVALPIYIFISLYSFYLFILKRMALSCMIVILCLFPISTFIFIEHTRWLYPWLEVTLFVTPASSITMTLVICFSYHLCHSPSTARYLCRHLFCCHPVLP